MTQLSCLRSPKTRPGPQASQLPLLLALQVLETAHRAHWYLSEVSLVAALRYGDILDIVTWDLNMS